MVEDVHDHLRGGLQDAVAAWRADEQAQAAFVPDLRRRDAHFVFLRRADGVGAGRFEIEPAHEVVEGDTGARHDHRRAETAAEALRAGDGVALGVDGIEVGGAFVHPLTWVAGWDLAGRCAGEEAFTGGKLRFVADQRAAFGGEIGREQAGSGRVVDGGVGDAVGHRQLGRFDKVVQCLGGVVAHIGNVETLHDRQGF